MIWKEHHNNGRGFSRHYLTLYAIILGMEAKEVFEFGAGFSTDTILEALKLTGGKLTSCDIQKQKPRNNWTFTNRDSQSIDIDGTYDVVLHDGSHVKEVVQKDIDKILPRMKLNSLLLIHDTEHKDYKLNEVKINCKHEQVTLPYGYGLTIVRILEDFGNGKVEITWKKC